MYDLHHYLNVKLFTIFVLLGEGIDSVDAMAFDQLKLDDIDMNPDNKIGDGSFGEVYYVTFKNGTFRGHTEAAAKSLYQVPKGEVDIMRRVKHPNVVKLLAYVDERFTHLIVMELADQSLRKFLEDNKGKVPSQLLNKWVCEVCDAIQYLHEGVMGDDGKRMPVVHRDIKASNCLLFKKGASMLLKIADFSIARQTDHTTGMLLFQELYSTLRMEVMSLQL